MSILTPELKAAAEKRAWRNTLKRKVCSRTDFIHNAQYVHTPYDLCHEMVERLDQYTHLADAKAILVLNLEFVETLCYTMGIEKSKIWFVTECLEKAAVAKYHLRYSGINVIYADYLTWRNNNMKFDVIVGNPPYQAPQDREEKGRGRSGTTLWNQFVLKSIELCKDNGYICLIHPSKWRKPGDELNEVMRGKNLVYLEMHDVADGVKTFGVQTRYDWYIMQNIPNKGKTTIKDENGISTEVDLRKSPVIPNGMIGEIMSLIAKPGEERVEILYSRSAYGTDKPNMHKTETKMYPYSCIYFVGADGVPTFWYSSTKDNGHFGVPKVIFSSGHFVSKRLLDDTRGEYGLTQFSRGVVDTPENVKTIYKAMSTEKFRQMAVAMSINLHELDKDTFSYFRKDFWKQFVDENGNEL